MRLRKSELGLALLLSTSVYFSGAQAALPNDTLIEAEVTSNLTLSGKIGDAGLFAVQADDDAQLEIIATASSIVNGPNDHWLLLDWVDSGYQIKRKGNIQSDELSYLSGYRPSVHQVLLGQKQGQLTQIDFTNNPDNHDHDMVVTTSRLSEKEHGLGNDIDLDSDILSLVNITATDGSDHLVVCTSDYIHILDGSSLSASERQGGYCQVGDVDYLDSHQEIVTQYGYFAVFNGTSWQTKDSLAPAHLGDNFLVANVDDDSVEEILSQSDSEQIKFYNPNHGGSWVYISELQSAQRQFSVFDLDSDGFNEIVFDQRTEQEGEPDLIELKSVVWDDQADTHETSITIQSPFISPGAVKRLPTVLVDGNESGMKLFISNNQQTLPGRPLLNRFSLNFESEWSGIHNTADRVQEVISRTQITSGTISDFNLVQLSQSTVTETDYQFHLNKLSTESFSVTGQIPFDFSPYETKAVDTLVASDISDDDIDELHVGGHAGFDAIEPTGSFLTFSNEGELINHLNVPFITSINAMYVGDINGEPGPDYFLSGEYTEPEGGIGYLQVFNDGASLGGWFRPGTGDTSFKRVIASNIKGEADTIPEILGLHSQLAAFDPDAESNESRFYNLSNLDLTQFTPIRLNGQPFDFALASDALGYLYLLEPKDFDILARIKGCSSEISAITTLLVNDNEQTIVALCDSNLLTWLIQPTGNESYNFLQLASYPLNPDLNFDNVQLTPIIAGDNSQHLFALLKNKLHHLLIDPTIVDDLDNDGYKSYEDAFPEDNTQWVDADGDGLGDNQAGNNPDPSLNDTDNDGVLNPVDPDNEADNGLPEFVVTQLSPIKVSNNGGLTTVTIHSSNKPTATDFYDSLNGGPSPTITLQVDSETIPIDDNGSYVFQVPIGANIISWVAHDQAGNLARLQQSVYVYPTISFSSNTSTQVETQHTNIELMLSGPTPEGFTVTLGNQASSSADTADFEENSLPITVHFEEGESSQFISVLIIDDGEIESNESLNLIVPDAFEDDTWVVNPDQNQHSLLIMDRNLAPSLSLSLIQNSQIVSIPTNIGGDITLNLEINDPNSQDTHSVHWDLSSLGLGDAYIQNPSFNPHNIDVGVYTLNVSATDSGRFPHTVSESFIINIAYGDSDGDSHLDNVDAFPEDPLEWADDDNDGVGNNADAFDDNPLETTDSDGDGIGDNSDRFPRDSSESKDSDNDGVGDNADKFPRDSKESKDSDSDGVGDNADAFPNDADETKDSDGDGVGDNADAFPEDKTETVDSDGDKVGDNSDAFPNDPNESKDSDGDGVGDNLDAFPNDANETVDSDGDGVGDNGDDYPNDKSRSSISQDQGLDESGGAMYWLLLLLLPLIRKSVKQQ